MKEFFENISERLNNENDISDITWALCKTNEHFQKEFLNFCFNNEIKSDIKIFEREAYEGDFRLDFLIETDDKRYLLEVKKYNQNKHEEYKKIKGITKAFIAIYTLNEKLIYDYTVTWHDFIEHMKKEMKLKKELNNEMINCYLSYLISATDYFEGVPMNLSNFNSLFVFNETINFIVNQFKETELSKIDNKKVSPCFNNGYSGYKINFRKSNVNYVFWYGIAYFEETNIVIEFLDECTESIKKKLLDSDKGDYYKKPFKKEEDGSIYVGISEKYFNILCDDKKEFDEQKKILKSFFDDVMKIVF